MRFRHEAWAVHGTAFTRNPGAYGKDLRAKLARPRGDLSTAESVMSAWRAVYLRALRRFDVLLDAVFEGPAPQLEAVRQDYEADTFVVTDRLLEKTPIANALGWPALVFPTPGGPRQIMGPPGSEPALFAAARRLGRSWDA